MRLREVVMDGGPVEVRGAMELERTPDGLLPRRLPAWTRPQIPDLMMHTQVSLTAGVRLAFATDATVIELETHPRTIAVVGQLRRPPVYQLLVDGRLQPDAVAAGGTWVAVDRTKGPAGISFEPGGPVTTRWEGLPAGRKEVEIWLPTNSSVELRALRVDDGAAVSPPAEVRRRRWTHYGSSISHCMDVDRPFDAWPVMVAHRAGVELTDLALAGQCQLDPFMGKVIADAPADLISLKIGINLVNAASMSERTFWPAVHGLLDRIRERHPAVPLLVVSPIFCPLVEDHPGPTLPNDSGGFDIVTAPVTARPFGLTLRRIREMLAAVVGQRQADDPALHLLDGLDLFGAADQHLLYDRLHPTPEGYALIGERFLTSVFGPGGPFAPIR